MMGNTAETPGGAAHEEPGMHNADCAADGGPSEAIGYLIRSYTDSFRVWLDPVDDIEWWLGDEFEWPRNAESRFGRIQARMISLQNWASRDLFDPQSLRRFRCLLGEAIALALEGYVEVADESLRNAEEFATQRAGSFVRLSIIVTTACVAFLGACVNALGVGIGEGWGVVGAASAAGAIGAMFSSMTLPAGGSPLVRSRPLGSVPAGAARVMVGASAALFLTLAIRAGAVLPALAGQNGHVKCAIFVAAFVAGASERLVPSLIDRFEYRTEPQEGAAMDRKSGGTSKASRQSN